MVEGGDEIEPEGVPNSDTSLLPSSSSDEFILLSPEPEGGEDSRMSGSSGSGGSCDPWARMDELPSSLREKMLELKGERCVMSERGV